MFTISNNVPEYIINIVKSLTDKNGNLSSIKARHISQEAKDWFNENSQYITIRSLFNLLKNGLDSIPVCEYCKDVQLSPKQYEKGHHYCCNKHAQLDEKTKEKVRHAFEKYNGGHPLRDIKIRQQIEQTNIQKYGSSVACNSKQYIVEWLKTVYTGEILTSERSVINPYELDIYLPESGIAIEFDGLYWHSDKFKDKRYHQNKTLLCKDKNIHLIHIPELLWDKKQNIIKSIILNALKLNTIKIFARNTICKEIDFKCYSDFLTINHIQGPVSSKYRYELFYNDELIAVFGYGKSRFNKNELELHRYAPKLGYSIIGGFSKLLKHSGFNGTTYVDMNFFTGEGYLKNGFSFISMSEPSYIWINPSTGIYYTRYQTQKHKLKNILSVFDESLTESENMELNGYFKIYDSGCIKLKNI